MVEKGGTTLTITESKKGVSSWVRMGFEQCRATHGSLQQCIEDRRDGNWEKRWKEKGRSFSMVRVYNRAGCFLRVGVVDEASKRYNICIPKGKGSKGGWTAMVEALCQLGIIADRKVQQEGMRISGRPSPEKVKGRSFVDMVKAWGDKEPSPFEWRASSSGIRARGRSKKGSSVWQQGGGRCSTGIREMESKIGVYGRGEISKEVWVRILGLPVSLWVPSVLRRVGDACGGFLDVDPKTERMEELEWARILIKSDGANTPGSLVIGIEEISYSLSLWWESVPVLRQEEGRKRCLSDRLRGEREGTAERVFSHVGQLRGPDSWAGSAGPSSLKNQAAGPSLSPMGDQLGLRQVQIWDGLQLMDWASFRKESPSRRDREKAAVGPPSQDTEKMLEEEAARYGIDVNWGVLGYKGLLLLILLFWSVSGKGGLRPFWDAKGGAVIGSGSRNPNAEDRIEKRNGCWIWIGGGNPELLGQNQKKKGEDHRAGEILDWKVLNAKGTAGGVIICWDKRSLEILGVEEGQFSISCRFRNEGDGAIWVFTGVYGPFSREDREGLWEELGAIRGLWEEPWCLGGDFNITWGSFTWSGGLNNQTRARLDRFLATPCWLDQFSRVLNRRLPRPTSDHYPILLEGGGVRRGPSPFKFENMWLKAEGFQELIKGWWQGIEIGEKQSRCLQQVESWDSVEEVRSLTEVELNQKKEAKESYEKWVSMEEVHWRQLSRELWLREGDRNTGFFHRMANAHRRINAILEGDEWGQSPGPGRIHISFWQNSWETVKEDLLGLFKEFHDQNSFIKSLNHTFLVLIPKKGGVEELGDYRPISLLGGLYKLLAKVLANRIKKVIGKVISPDQNAFIKGRQILDGHAKDGLWIKMDRMDVVLYLHCQILSAGERGSQLVFSQARKGGATTYCLLGLPLGAPNRDVSAWMGWKERTRRRLSLWKRQYLSKGGRLTLIKSTLSSFPLYQMSIFRMPKSVARRIEKLQRDFLWGGTNGGTKSHLVKWEAVCVEKEKGGLGLRKITILNKALLGKWIWRFACAKEEFWKKVLEAKYGKEEFGWRTRKANGRLVLEFGRRS
ncbi:putative ribonuclease H protein [Vitis vinifera]|uniref:Putative ribonuclease H protein n=1 Tax=Vitis vinifera TaxID=29760 RepID=A0A438IE93_VITVI|nr:putative ribonuclease H protein [Vitis vinifera]